MWASTIMLNILYRAAPPPPNPPPPDPPNPPPPNPPPPSISCDITVIGCGLAGATSAASISYFVHNKSLCIVCPSIYESTSAASGNGWLLVPTVENEEYLLNELAIYASEKSIGFEREHAEQFIKDFKQYYLQDHISNTFLMKGILHLK